MRAELDAPLHRLDDLRMGVAHHHHAVAVVIVDVLVPVDVPHARALAAVDVDRVRRPHLPRGRDAARQVTLRLLAVTQGPRLLRIQRVGLPLRQLLDQTHVDLDGVRVGVHGTPHSFDGHDETAAANSSKFAM